MSMLITNAGRTAIQNALADGSSIVITEMAFGTANRHPTGGETALTTEVLRKPVIAQGVTGMQTYFDAQLEVDDGPFVIYEVGLFDEDGALLFIGRVEGLNKPVQQDQPVTVDMRVLVLTSQFQNVTVTVDSTFSYAPTDRSVATDDGLTGGGNLTQNRTLKLAVGALPEITAAAFAAADRFLVYDASVDAHRKLSGAELVSILIGLGLAANARAVSTGEGLTGGGNLTADRTLKLNVSGLAALASGAVSLADALVLWDDSAAAHKRITLDQFFAAFGGLRGATATQLLEAVLDDRFVTPDAVGDATAFVALADQSTITPNLDAARNFTVTIAADRTLGNPTNQRSGQTGEIVVTQDATGARSLDFGSHWKFIGSPPNLSPVGGSSDVISYKVVSPGFIIAACNSVVS